IRGARGRYACGTYSAHICGSSTTCPSASMTAGRAGSAGSAMILPSGTASGAASSGLGLLDELDIDGDGDLVAHQRAAAIERLVPVNAEILAIDLCVDDTAEPYVAERVVDAVRRSLNKQNHLLGDAVHCQVAGHLELVVDQLLHRRRLE